MQEQWQTRGGSSALSDAGGCLVEKETPNFQKRQAFNMK